MIFTFTGCSFNIEKNRNLYDDLVRTEINDNNNSIEAENSKIERNTMRDDSKTQTIAINSSTSFEQESSSKGLTFTPDFNNINDIIGLSKVEVLDRLGKDYKITAAGAEHAEEGYSYEQYGITIIFNNSMLSEPINKVVCDEKVDIKGVKLGMTFSEIRQMLGEGESRELVQIEPDQPKYALFYKFDNFTAWFGAVEKDDPTTVLQIR